MNFRSPVHAVFLGCVLVMMLQRPAAYAAEPANLVTNEDFSKVENGQPYDWEAVGDSAFVTQTLRVAPDADGKVCAQLSCTRFERQAPAAHAMLAQVGKVRLIRRPCCISTITSR